MLQELETIQDDPEFALKGLDLEVIASLEKNEAICPLEHLHPEEENLAAEDPEDDDEETDDEESDDEED
jgi:hypothetical protein